MKVTSQAIFRGFLGGVFIIIGAAASAQTVNFKNTGLTCTFTHRCFPGHQVKRQANGVWDYSACKRVNERVSWDPASGEIIVKGKVRQVVSTRLKRRTATVQAVVGETIVTLAASKAASSLRVTDIRKPGGPVIDFYNGTCEGAG